MGLVHPSARPAIRAFSRLLIAAASLTLGLMVLGAAVHDLGAGLACPDPVLCYGQVVPAFDLQILVQWLHRVLALALAGSVVAAIVWSFRVPALRQPFGLQLAVALVLVVVEGVLGGLSVTRHLAVLPVAAHRLNGVLLLTVLIWASARAVTLGKDLGNVRPLRPVSRQIRRAFGALTLLMLVELGLGGLAVGLGASLPCPVAGDCGLKLWAGLTPDVILPLVDRAIVLALLVGSVVLSLAISRLTLPRISRIAVRLSPSLLVAQIVIGMVNVHFGLPLWASVAQRAVAALQYALLLLGTVTLYEDEAAGARPVLTLPLNGAWRMKDQPI
jgi:cytochrome c oxidase assembly protein subunit 15